MGIRNAVASGVCDERPLASDRRDSAADEMGARGGTRDELQMQVLTISIY